MANMRSYAKYILHFHNIKFSDRRRIVEKLDKNLLYFMYKYSGTIYAADAADMRVCVFVPKASTSKYKFIEKERLFQCIPIQFTD
jgi:hypothetical protein